MENSVDCFGNPLGPSAIDEGEAPACHVLPQCRVACQFSNGARKTVRIEFVKAAENASEPICGERRGLSRLVVRRLQHN